MFKKKKVTFSGFPSDPILFGGCADYIYKKEKNDGSSDVIRS